MLIGLFAGAMLVLTGAAIWGTTEAAANGRLPRNGWGGIRIGLTGASDEAWLAGHQAALPVSRAAGLGSLLVGLALMIEGVTTRNEDGSPLFWTLTGVGYGGVLIAAVVAAVHAHRGATA